MITIDLRSSDTQGNRLSAMTGMSDEEIPDKGSQPVPRTRSQRIKHLLVNPTTWLILSLVILGSATTLIWGLMRPYPVFLIGNTILPVVSVSLLVLMWLVPTWVVFFSMRWVQRRNPLSSLYSQHQTRYNIMSAVTVTAMLLSALYVFSALFVQSDIGRYRILEPPSLSGCRIVVEQVSQPQVNLGDAFVAYPGKTLYWPSFWVHQYDFDTEQVIELGDWIVTWDGFSGTLSMAGLDIPVQCPA